MDDYYELLDVAPDAEREEIRGAYRTKRDDLQAQEGADNRSKIAELNRAWNVLSDPTQRQRYDDRLAEWRDSGDEDDEYEYDDDEDADERPVPVTRAQRRNEIRKARQQRMPTIELPKGLTMAPTRSRVMAMLLDLLVLLVLFTTVQYLGSRQIDHRYPGEQHKQSQEIKKADSIQKQINTQKDKVSAAQKAHDTAAASAAKAKQNSLQRQHDALKKDVSRITKELGPSFKVVFLIGMVVAFLYLVPATALTGQTLGKRFQRIRVVNLDGSAPGWKTAYLRFGVPLLVGLLLGAVLGLGLLGLAVAVIGMVGWFSHPNRQGLHDRLAKTVVVEA